MPRPALKVADIFRAWRNANAGHLSLGQLKVMSAIERCRMAALGGHVAVCEKCEHTQIAYNSCRNVRAGNGVEKRLSKVAVRIKVYIACQAIESKVITPIMLSRRLTLNAVVVLLAVVAWGRLWGVSGALMAVPLLAVLKVIADRVDGLAGLSAFLGGREPAPD